MRSPTPSISRRDVLARLGGGLALVAAVVRAARAQKPVRSEAPVALAPEDERLLEEIQRATFLFFWEQSDPATGLVRDRFNVRAASDSRTAASIAATGFGLTAICIGAQRGYMPVEEARARARAALGFLDTGSTDCLLSYWSHADEVRHEVLYPS